MIDGEYFVTPHAVHQFIERVPGYRRFPFEVARNVIIYALRHFARSTQPTRNGEGVCVRVRSPHVNFRAIVMPGQPAPSVVTILRSGN